MEYQEHEGNFEELQARLGIKLNVANLSKSEGLTPEEAKKCVPDQLFIYIYYKLISEGSGSIYTCWC